MQDRRRGAGRHRHVVWLDESETRGDYSKDVTAQQIVSSGMSAPKAQKLLGALPK